MLTNNRRTNLERGDTLVEVLIAILVVTVVLVAGYVTTTQNIDTMQDTQEHSEALQLAQTQLEYLHDSTAQPTAGNECFVAVGALNGTLESSNSSYCKVTSGGNTASIGQPAFQIDISPLGATSPGTYDVLVEWTGLNSSQNNNDKVTLFYQP